MSEEEVTEMLRVGICRYCRDMTQEEAIQILSQLYSYDENGQLRKDFGE